MLPETCKGMTGAIWMAKKAGLTVMPDKAPHEFEEGGKATLEEL